MTHEEILAQIAPVLAVYAVPLPLIEAIIDVESGWNPGAQGDIVNGLATSWGLFQLHLGGQADRALQALTGHGPWWNADEVAKLYDPATNATYALPAIASAWEALKGSFDPRSLPWWLSFAAESGHPGGSVSDPMTTLEAKKLQDAYLSRSEPQPMPIPLNAAGELADLLSVSQFVPGRSAYECVAYSAALCVYAGPPGHGPTGTVLQASNLAQYYYGFETGSTTASNTSGMSLAAMHDMLTHMGLLWQDLPATIASIQSALMDRKLVLVCGAETGMVDLGLGDHVPYNWRPTGNHCIVATGMTPQGILVHDCANVDGNGVVRPGPRLYDEKKLAPVSVTSVTPHWLSQENPMLTLTSPNVSDYFEAVSASEWRCKQNGVIISGEILSFYQAMNGLTWLSLPRANATPVPGSKHGAVQQPFKNAWVRTDPAFEFDHPLGLTNGHTYMAHLDDYAQGTGDPNVSKLLATVKSAETLVAQLASTLSALAS